MYVPCMLYRCNINTETDLFHCHNTIPYFHNIQDPTRTQTNSFWSYCTTVYIYISTSQLDWSLFIYLIYIIVRTTVLHIHYSLSIYIVSLIGLRIYVGYRHFNILLYCTSITVSVSNSITVSILILILILTNHIT